MDVFYTKNSRKTLNSFCPLSNSLDNIVCCHDNQTEGEFVLGFFQDKKMRKYIK